MDSKNSKPKTRELEAYSESQRSVALQQRILREKLKMDQAVSLLLFGASKRRSAVFWTQKALRLVWVLSHCCPVVTHDEKGGGPGKVFSPRKFSRGIQCRRSMPRLAAELLTGTFQSSQRKNLAASWAGRGQAGGGHY